MDHLKDLNKRLFALVKLMESEVSTIEPRDKDKRIDEERPQESGLFSELATGNVPIPRGVCPLCLRG